MTLKLSVDFGELKEHEFDRVRISVGRSPLSDVVIAADTVPRTLGHILRQDAHFEWVGEATAACIQLFRDGKLQNKSQNAASRWVLQAGDELRIGGLGGQIRIVACDAHTTAPSIHLLSLARHDYPALEASVARAVATHPHPGTLLRAIAGVTHARTGALPRRVALTTLEMAGALHRDTWAMVPESAEGGLAVGMVEQAGDPLMRLEGHAQKVLDALHRVDAVLVDHHSVRTIYVPLGTPLRAYAAFDWDTATHDAATLHEVALAAHELDAVATLCFTVVETRRTLAGTLEENRYYRERERRHYLFKELVAESEAMRHVFERLNTLVDAPTPILITGEAGTGKELLARAIHHFGAPKSGMLFALNCARVEHTDVDVELFGCVANEFQGSVVPRKGVFELAADGTVFLEEIDQLSPMLQGKLVRMLKEGEVRRAGDPVGRPVQARLVASIHRPLDEVVDSHKLRRDLYLLLKDSVLNVPRLQDRHEDILPLARTFLKNYAKRYNKHVVRFDEPVLEALVAHTWPGNVRELQMLVEVAVLKATGDVVRVDDIRF